MNISRQCAIELPDWVDAWLDSRPTLYSSPNEQMQLAIDLAAMNIRSHTGGPFGAAIFEQDSGKLVSVGINLVTATGLSMAHAEMVAISLAQESLGTWNLAAKGRFVLATSCEPCAMCFGAVPWSGISLMICGAQKADAESAGFDEGAKPDDWTGALQERGIEVQTNVLRAPAADLFELYRQLDGQIYNAEADK